MSVPQRLFSFALACASSVIVARAQSQTTPSPEVKKLAVMVGTFAIEDELKAGFMGPNSPAMKFSGTDECRWTAGGFGLTCTYAYDVGGTKWAGTGLVYYDSTPKKYRYHAVNNLGEIEDQTGMASGDTWTWTGESSVGGKTFHVQLVTKVISKDSYEYTESWGESENSMEPSMSGKDTRVAIAKPATSKPAQ
jgi:hypothetical protein